MKAEEQKAAVFEHLRRREEIAAQTRQQLAEVSVVSELDPLSTIDADVRMAAEDEFYAAQGRRRYKTSDGRTLFLTPDEIAQRRRARTQRSAGGRPRSPSRGRYYGTGENERRHRWLSLGFNAGAVLLALGLVYLILH